MSTYETAPSTTQKIYIYLGILWLVWPGACKNLITEHRPHRAVFRAGLINFTNVRLINGSDYDVIAWEIMKTPTRHKHRRAAFYKDARAGIRREALSAYVYQLMISECGGCWITVTVGTELCQSKQKNTSLVHQWCKHVTVQWRSGFWAHSLCR